LQRQLPERMNQIIEKLIRNELSLKFQHENLEPLQRTLEDTASRLTVAVIIGAMVIGSSLIISAQVGPTLFGFPVLGIIGYVISAVLGLWIVINVLRSKW
jgi:ubiquinone biosynthesis protein